MTSTIWNLAMATIAIITIAVAIKVHRSVRTMFVDKKMFETVELYRHIIFDDKKIGLDRNVSLSLESILLALGCSSEIVNWYKEKLRSLPFVIEDYFGGNCYGIGEYRISKIIAATNGNDYNSQTIFYMFEIVRNCTTGGNMALRFYVVGSKLNEPIDIFPEGECKLSLRRKEECK